MPPNSPATPNRNVRVPDELWDEVLRIAGDQHETATDVVLRALRAYVRNYPAQESGTLPASRARAASRRRRDPQQ